MLSAKEIAQFVSGTIQGNESATVESVAKIEEATDKDLAFLSNPKYEHFLYKTKAAIVFVNKNIIPKEKVNCTLIKTDNPYLSFCMCLDKYFNPNIHPKGIEQPNFVAAAVGLALDEESYIGAFSYVAHETKLGKGVKIYPQVYIGNDCEIGDNTVLYPGVKVMPGCKIGNNCIIHSGTVIGSDGFGFAPMPDGSYSKIPQVGNVIIEENVEIGSNCSIDRATMGSTIIRKGVKLDNLIQVAHNAEIGAHTVIAAQTGISGSTKLGKRCVIGGQVGFVGHISVADGTQIGAQSGVQRAIIQENQQFIGSPIMPLREAFKTQVLVRNLPQINERLNKLEKDK